MHKELKRTISELKVMLPGLVDAQRPEFSPRQRAFLVEVLPNAFKRALLPIWEFPELRQIRMRQLFDFFSLLPPPGFLGSADESNPNPASGVELNKASGQ